MSIALVSCFKNEGHIIEEWIEHYIAEGVDCFLLTDNGSTDDYLQKIQRYIDQGIVVLRVDPTKHKQINHLNAFLDKAKQFDWVVAVDLDEFVYARKGYSTIKQYLQSLDKAVGCVSIPWKMFGSNGHIEQPASAIYGFTQRMGNVDIDICCKSIVRGTVLESFDIHFHYIAGGKTINSNGCETLNNPFARISEELLENSYLHLNHYAIQSWDYFSTVKMTRGSANVIANDNIRTATYFKEYDHNDIVDNELAQKYAKRDAPSSPPLR